MNRLFNKKLLFVLVWFLPLTQAYSMNFSDRSIDYSLSNGLNVVLIKDTRSPIVVSSIWYKVGSSYEREGISGISHILEHLMFKGTKTMKPGEFSRKIKQIGGSENAFTGRDFTGYYQKVHKDYLELCLELESDRMNNLIFVQDEVSKEIEVVKEERRLRTDDQPISKLFEKINNQIFGMTRYGIPIVGTMDDIGSIKISDLKEWYDNYYTPSNATVIIAGDIDFIKTKKMIEKHYGQIEDRKVIRSVDSINHKISYKDILVRDKVSQPIVLMSYKHEPFSDDNKKEMYALELLFELMDGSNSSRFTKNLVDKKKVAMNTFISFDTYSANDNLITLGGSPRSGISIDQFKNEMLNEFEVFVKKGLEEGELDRIKSRLLANNIYKFDSVFYQVMQVGMLETKGYNWELLDTYINDINSINENDLKKIASKIILNKEYLYSSILPKS
jgi:zinc protease|tara:strand:- start:1652 stop:2986 length:1335 start_codon:yes stop_codon:yes gene_type:complete